MVHYPAGSSHQKMGTLSNVFRHHATLPVFSGQMGVRIANDLNDWLILAQSEAELVSHRSFLQPLRMSGSQGQFCQPANELQGFKVQGLFIRHIINYTGYNQ